LPKGAKNERKSNGTADWGCGSGIWAVKQPQNGGSGGKCSPYLFSNRDISYKNVENISG
jgi:hypothetical protein